MFNFTNYYQQSKRLPAENGFQLMILQWTDKATLVREISKSTTIVGLIVSAASLVFSFNPKTALTITAISGVTWGVSHFCANELEPQAKTMIEHFKEHKKEKYGVFLEEAEKRGL